MKVEKWSTWVCIAWERGSSRIVTKQLAMGFAISERKAMAMFRKKYPELRNHTVQQSDSEALKGGKA